MAFLSLSSGFLFPAAMNKCIPPSLSGHFWPEIGLMAFFDCLPFLEILVFISKCRTEAAGKVIESFLSSNSQFQAFFTKTTPISPHSSAHLLKPHLHKKLLWLYGHYIPRMDTRIAMSVLIFSLIGMITQVPARSSVPFSFLESAVSKGAVCLDGTAPAYAYVEGSGDGAHSWIVYLEGGAWCNNLTDCYDRSHSKLGSSNTLRGTQIGFSSMLDFNCTSDPDFCHWHKLYIHYCDGSSFMSDVMNKKANLSFRGARIFDIMMEEMLSKGMGNAKQAILSGSSAGGLAAMLNCDKFHKLFPGRTEVKCISDSGFFLHGKDLFDAKFRESFFAGVIETHELAKSLPPSCTSKRDSNLCLFPEYFAGDIQTPLFIIESSFDKYQLTSLLNINLSCTENITRCNSAQVEIIREFKKTFVKTLVGLKESSSRGMFVHSCYLHAHIPSSTRWTGLTLGGRSLGQAVADWSFDRSSVRELDDRNDLPEYCIFNHTTTSSGAALPRAGFRYHSLIFLSIPFLFL